MHGPAVSTGGQKDRTVSIHIEIVTTGSQLVIQY
jgi:hypothetical protein